MNKTEYVLQMRQTTYETYQDVYVSDKKALPAMLAAVGEGQPGCHMRVIKRTTIVSTYEVVEAEG